jgi:hypothetical protein
MAEEDDFVRITLRLPAALHASLNEAAAKKRSMNAEIIARLERSLREQDYQKEVSDLRSAVTEIHTMLAQEWKFRHVLDDYLYKTMLDKETMRDDGSKKILKEIASLALSLSMKTVDKLNEIDGGKD